MQGDVDLLGLDRHVVRGFVLDQHNHAVGEAGGRWWALVAPATWIGDPPCQSGRPMLGPPRTE